MSNDQEWKDGSTGIVVLIYDQKIYCANAGDCRAVMCENGSVVPLSKDHKPDDPIEKERIVKYVDQKQFCFTK